MSYETRSVTTYYIDGIKSGRESLVRHGIEIASEEVENLKKTIKGFGSSSPVGQFLRGERDFWMHQIARSTTSALARIGAKP